jgi:hypothetical protein
LRTKHDILLLSSTDPRGDGIGSLFLRDLIATDETLSVTPYVVPTFLLSGIANSTNRPLKLISSISTYFGQSNRLHMDYRIESRSHKSCNKDQPVKHQNSSNDLGQP